MKTLLFWFCVFGFLSFFFLPFFLSFFNFMYLGIFFPVCASVYHVCTVSMGPRRRSQVWDWSYRWLVSHHVGAGTRTWVICKNSWCSQLLNHSPVLSWAFSLRFSSKILKQEQQQQNPFTHTTRPQRSIFLAVSWDRCSFMPIRSLFQCKNMVAFSWLNPFDERFKNLLDDFISYSVRFNYTVFGCCCFNFYFSGNNSFSVCFRHRKSLGELQHFQARRKISSPGWPGQVKLHRGTLSFVHWKHHPGCPTSYWAERWPIFVLVLWMGLLSDRGCPVSWPPWLPSLL